LLLSFFQIRLAHRGGGQAAVSRYSCSNRAEANERMGIIKDLGASTQPSSMRDKAYMTMFHLVYN
jgi:hypothetical protein